MRTDYYELPDGIYYETRGYRILRSLSHATATGKLTVRETLAKAGRLYLFLTKTYPHDIKRFKESFLCHGRYCSSTYVTYCEGIGHVAYEHIFNCKTGRIQSMIIPLSAYSSQSLPAHRIIRHI